MQTGLIRIVVGTVLVMGSVGGMEHQMDAPLILQLALSVVGLFLLIWAAKDRLSKGKNG